MTTDQQGFFERKMRAAYRLDDATRALRELETLAVSLDRPHPGAAASLSLGEQLGVADGEVLTGFKGSTQHQPAARTAAGATPAPAGSMPSSSPSLPRCDHLARTRDLRHCDFGDVAKTFEGP